MMRKLFSKWKNLKWYAQILILLTLLGLLYYAFKEYNFLVIVIGVALMVKFLWRSIFCRAIIKENQVDFNLSIFAELILMLWYLAFAGLIGFGLFTKSTPWYGYIIPVLILLVNLARLIEVFGNRRDYIRFSGKTLSWKDGEKTGALELKAYFFEDRKTEAFEFKVSGDATGPFLIATDSDNNVYSFDLKSMNLGGHYVAMNEYLASNYTEMNKK